MTLMATSHIDVFWIAAMSKFVKYCIYYFIFLHTSFFYENTQDCYIVKIFQKLIFEVYSISHLDKNTRNKKKFHKVAIANTSVCDVATI